MIYFVFWCLSSDFLLVIDDVVNANHALVFFSLRFCTYYLTRAVVCADNDVVAAVVLL